MRRRQRFIHVQLGWMTAVVVMLTFVEALSIELFFVLSLIGFLAAVELTAPINITPQWRRRLRWVILLGVLGFGYIVTKRAAEILGYI